ncbi:MAG: hypothetical protein ACI9FN_002054 [Saprospiraceae bacterium]|jgi:hypothetical protein
MTAHFGDIIIEGFDENHQIKNVRFIDCKTGNTLNADTTSIKTNSYVNNTTFGNWNLNLDSRSLL